MFNTIDDQFNNHEGWFVDNIEIGPLKNGEMFINGAETIAERSSLFMSGSNGTGPAWHSTIRRSSSGRWSWWYGDESIGTYEGQPDPTPGLQDDDQCEDLVNSGRLNTPIIELGDSPQLRFQTLWEIEGANSDRFDLMQVRIRADSDGDGQLDNSQHIASSIHQVTPNR